MPRLRRLSIAALFLLLLSVGLALGQAKPAPAATPAVNAFLTVLDESGKTTKLTAADLSKLKRLSAKGAEHGKEGDFAGVALVDVLRLAGVVFGEPLRGKRLATYLLVEASDKYQAVFALPELDPGFSDKIIILADTRDGKPLSADEGPWRIIVPDEKRPARWVRQVARLKILRAP